MLTARIRWDETHVILVAVDPADYENVALALIDEENGTITNYTVTVGGGV